MITVLFLTCFAIVSAKLLSNWVGFGRTPSKQESGRRGWEEEGNKEEGSTSASLAPRTLRFSEIKQRPKGDRLHLHEDSHRELGRDLSRLDEIVERVGQGSPDPAAAKEDRLRVSFGLNTIV